MLTSEGLLKLVTWLSPSFPVGAYTYSHGLEFAVESGLITSGESLREWCEGVLLFGSAQTDGLFFAQAWKLAARNELDKLLDLNAQANAMRTSAELALEAEAQGRAFLTTLLDIHAQPNLSELASKLKIRGEHASYPVIVGAVVGFEEIDCEAALVAYLHAFAANLISAGVRLVPLGQTAGQQALMGLESVIAEAVEIILEKDFGDIGSSAPVIDWTSMQHEIQYTRLFRS